MYYKNNINKRGRSSIMIIQHVTAENTPRYIKPKSEFKKCFKPSAYVLLSNFRKQNKHNQINSTA